MNLRAEINSGWIGCSRVAERICGGVSEGLSFACCSSSPGASLEAAHKPFKLDSVNLSPAAVLAWSDPAHHHMRSNRFCCFTDCRIRSIHRLVKVGHGSSWLCYAANRFLNGSAGVPECDIWAEEQWWSLTDDFALGSSFSPALTCVGEDSQITGAGEKQWMRQWDAHLKASECFIGLYCDSSLFLGQYTILPLAFLIATLGFHPSNFFQAYCPVNWQGTWDKLLPQPIPLSTSRPPPRRLCSFHVALWGASLAWSSPEPLPCSSLCRVLFPYYSSYIILLSSRTA